MVGRKIGQYRRKLGLTLEEICQRTRSTDPDGHGIEPPYLAMVEHGECDPTLLVLQWLSLALGSRFVISDGATDLEEEEPDEQHRSAGEIP